jgi:hypothetical protein
MASKIDQKLQKLHKTDKIDQYHKITLIYDLTNQPQTIHKKKKNLIKNFF